MGSFNATCCISGLPITYRDRVRYFLLTQNPYDESRSYDIHGYWYPRTLPLKATYNDYGSVKDVEEGPARDVWMEGFQKDLVERGVGDNSCHDSLSRKDMTFEQLLEALWERRVSVKRDLGDRDVTEEEQKAWEARQPSYIPTMRSVEAALGVEPNTKYHVDNDHGYVRIRTVGYGTKDESTYAEALAALSEYAAVVCAGSGSYADAAEVRVFMKPGKDAQGHDRRDYKADEEKETLVCQAMIREDVWQELLKVKFVVGWKGEMSSISKHREGLRAYYGKYASAKAEYEAEKDELKKIRLEIKRMRMEDGTRDLPGAWIAGRSAIPFGISIAEHASLLLEKGPFPDGYTDTMAEFAYICGLLSSSRYVWRPTDSSGDQNADWKTHLQVLTAYARVARKEIATIEKEREGDED